MKELDGELLLGAIRQDDRPKEAEAQDLAEVTDRRTPVMEHERRDGLGPACGPRRSWTTQGEAARSGVTVRVSPGERRDLARAPAREVGEAGEVLQVHGQKVAYGLELAPARRSPVARCGRRAGSQSAILLCRSAAPSAARFGEAVSEGSFVRSDTGCGNGCLVGASDDTDILRLQASEVL